MVTTGTVKPIVAKEAMARAAIHFLRSQVPYYLTIGGLTALFDEALGHDQSMHLTLSPEEWEAEAVRVVTTHWHWGFKRQLGERIPQLFVLGWIATGEDQDMAERQWLYLTFPSMNIATGGNYTRGAPGDSESITRLYFDGIEESDAAVDCSFP